MPEPPSSPSKKPRSFIHQQLQPLNSTKIEANTRNAGIPNLQQQETLESGNLGHSGKNLGRFGPPDEEERAAGTAVERRGEERRGLDRSSGGGEGDGGNEVPDSVVS